jgi:hypothetical protein
VSISLPIGRIVRTLGIQLSFQTDTVSLVPIFWWVLTLELLCRPI